MLQNVAKPSYVTVEVSSTVTHALRRWHQNGTAAMSAHSYDLCLRCMSPTQAKPALGPLHSRVVLGAASRSESTDHREEAVAARNNARTSFIAICRESMPRDDDTADFISGETAWMWRPSPQLCDPRAYSRRESARATAPKSAPDHGAQCARNGRTSDVEGWKVRPGARTPKRKAPIPKDRGSRGLNRVDEAQKRTPTEKR